MSTSQDLPSSVFIFGCGYVGTALARHLMAAGIRVGALTRNAEKAARLRDLGLSQVIEADLDSRDWHRAIAGRYTGVVNCVSSAGGGLAGYRQSYLEGQRSILRWAQDQAIEAYVYTSSTSVYPQDGGATVDETSATDAAPPTGRVVRESEVLLESAAFLKRCYVLRLAGIYGPGRHYLLDQLREGAGEIPGLGDYALNMIHLDDIVSAICAALSGRAASGIYNIADDGPATKAEVLTHLAKSLGLPELRFNPEIVSERLKRRGGRMPHRFVSNAKAKAALAWAPKYPSYREGYAALA